MVVVVPMLRVCLMLTLALPAVVVAALQLDAAVLTQGKVQGDFKVTQALLTFLEAGVLATCTNHSMLVMMSTT
jgi:hypothetical protein